MAMFGYSVRDSYLGLKWGLGRNGLPGFFPLKEFSGRLDPDGRRGPEPSLLEPPLCGPRF
jgi:hypothetical protein